MKTGPRQRDEAAMTGGNLEALLPPANRACGRRQGLLAKGIRLLKGYLQMFWKSLKLCFLPLELL